MIPIVGFLPPDDDRVTGTIDAVRSELARDGLLSRYSTAETDDGLPGGEGQFLACSFWLVSALALNGRVGEARTLFERLLGLANDLGLLAEEYDVERQRQVGNFPQAFSHLALIDAAAAITAAGRRTAPSAAPAGPRRPYRVLRRRAEPQHAAAERDRADREPRRAEREPADHVAQPVHVEQHAAAGHGDRERRPRSRRSPRACGGSRPRLSSSAAAAKNATDQDECPLGNDGPSVSAIGLSVGRTRSTRCLTVVVRMPFPATTTKHERHDPAAAGADGLGRREQGGEDNDDRPAGRAWSRRRGRRWRTATRGGRSRPRRSRPAPPGRCRARTR